MKTKAAIAYATGKPLEVVTVELGGPKAPLEKINDAFDLMHRGESIRSVVTF